MSAIKHYLAESIPLQMNRAGEYVVRLDKSGGSYPSGLADAPFAEIEYDSIACGATDGAPTWRQPVLAPQPLAQRPADPIRQRFDKMRRLADQDPFQRNNMRLFYRQAKFMEDFADDFEEYEPFTMPYPYYQMMGYRQLRTYFTWRKKVRGGDIQTIDQAYVFLYINELLLNIGVADPADGLNKLTALWKAFNNTELTAILNNYLPLWLRDYHVYYDLPESFGDFAKKNDLIRHYPLMFLLEADAEKSLELWSSISKYNITKSKFYIAGNGELVRDCFFAVLCGVRELLAGKYISLKHLLFYNDGGRIHWQPFQGALFFNWRVRPDCQVQMPGGDIFSCKKNYWLWQTSLLTAEGKALVGYLIKKTEACLRQTVKFKNKLTVSSDSLYTYEKRLNVVGLSLAMIDSAIEKAVADFYTAATRTVVEVDQINLARIRQEAVDTQEKLLVDFIEADTEVAPADIRAEQKPVLIDDAWENLKQALNTVETQALIMALDGRKDIKQFADENSLMLEVLAEGINEKAADLMGDNILEVAESLTVYEDYVENIRNMVKL